ncbi:MAG: DUF1566 domain-containing protein [Methylovulum sp.]|nr:DUF1566 domain-containing protein [Methylovulum sp.]
MPNCRPTLAFVYAIFALYWCFNPAIAYSTTNRTTGTALSESPTVIKLVEVASVKKGTLTISWLPTTDDNTPHEKLLYQIYLYETADFLPDATTLKVAKTGAVSAEIKNLKPGKRYFVLVTATDQDGNVSWSNLMTGHTVAFNAKRTKTAVHTVSVAQMQTAAATGRVALSATKPVAAGDYLVNSEQGGYLRQVISTAKAKNGATITDTASAPLNEVFSDLSFNTTVKFQDLPAQSTTASRMASTAKSSKSDASINWKDTGLTLSDSEAPPAKPAIGKSALVVNGEQQIQSGRFMTLSAPAYVGVEPGQTEQWTAVMRVPVLKSSETELCNAELLSFTHRDPRKNRLSKPTTTFTRTQDSNGEYRSGILRMDWQPTDSHVDLQGFPYRAKMRAYVDVKKNACQGNLLGFWKETLDMEIPVYVIKGTPDAARKDQLITFNGSFSVKDSVSYDIKPELVIGATLSGGFLRTANLLAKADLSFTNKLTITANGAATLDQRIPVLKEKRFIKVFLAGGVPIVVSGKFKIDAQINGSVNGKMALNKTLDLKFPDTEFGLKYYSGAWHTVGKTDPGYQLKIFGEADARAELTLTLIPDLQVSFYDAASGRLLVEPYLYAQADWQGQFKYQGLALADLDYWFTELEAGAGANLHLYAGLSIFDYNIASYPANTTIDQIDQFAFKVIMPKTPLAKLPTLTSEVNWNPDIAAPTDSRTLAIHGKAEDYVEGTFLHQSLITFTQWTKPGIFTADGLPAETAKFTATDKAGQYWFTYQAAGTYTARLAGYNNLGKYVRQVAEQVIELTDNDNDGMIDQWEERYGVSDPTADEDDDGADNLAEFNAGTYPHQRFIKIANNGQELPYSAALGNRPNDWACIKDTKTGLIWEVKTSDGGLRDGRWRYSWYDPQYLPDGKNPGGNPDGTMDPDPFPCGTDIICAGFKNPEKIFDFGYKNKLLCNAKPLFCNTYDYMKMVNARSLCGVSDWRLPSIKDLGDTYPYTDQVFSSGMTSSSYCGYGVYYKIPNYSISRTSKIYPTGVTLVRGGQPVSEMELYNEWLYNECR